MTIEVFTRDVIEVRPEVDRSILVDNSNRGGGHRRVVLIRGQPWHLHIIVVADPGRLFASGQRGKAWIDIAPDRAGNMPPRSPK